MGKHRREPNSTKPQVVLNKKVDPETGNYQYMLVKSSLAIWHSSPRSPFTRTPQHLLVQTRIGGDTFRFRGGHPRKDLVWVGSGGAGVRVKFVETQTFQLIK